MVTVSLLPWLITLGLPTAIRRFLAAATDTSEIREGFYSMLLIILLASSIVCGLLFLFVPQIAASLFHNNTTIACCLY